MTPMTATPYCHHHHHHHHHQLLVFDHHHHLLPNAHVWQTQVCFFIYFFILINGLFIVVLLPTSTTPPRSWRRGRLMTRLNNNDICHHPLPSTTISLHCHLPICAFSLLSSLTHQTRPLTLGPLPRSFFEMHVQTFVHAFQFFFSFLYTALLDHVPTHFIDNRQDSASITTNAQQCLPIHDHQ